MAKKPLVHDGQYLLDLAEVRERLAALRKKMERLDELKSQELAARNELKRIRRLITECGWDIRNLAAGVRRDSRDAQVKEEMPDGEKAS